MYQLARPALFAMDAESAHRFTLGALRRAPWLLSAFPEAGEDPVEVMGLRFRNRLGLAAGLDKNAECIDAWTRLGFGLIEIGTVTPKPQPGNPRPRMFRLPEHGAIINRLGFNNAGLDVVLDNIRGSDRGSARLGINLGKNAVTPAEHALDDYREGMQRAYELADYLTVNISSPNTVGLRDLQAGQARDALLRGLADCREMLAQQHGRRVPVAIKIAPDLEPDEVRALGEAVVNVGFEALIATNTTIRRDAVAGHRYAGEAGGLSGDPVREPSTRLLQLLREHLGSACALIGVGGVMRPEHAVEKLRAGADLVQIYTGFIYAGPALVARSVDVMRQAGFTQVKP